MEQDILATAHHPFIVTMYASFQTTSYLGFVMEYCEGGEFFDVLQKQTNCRLPERAALFYAAEVLLALEYLHYCGFVYRDLKPENILMRADGHIALTDFDLSTKGTAKTPVLSHQKLPRRHFHLGRSSTSSASSSHTEILDSEPELRHTRSVVGTSEYMAPEVCRSDDQTPAVDWWTLGILIYEMLTGTTPFAETARTQGHHKLFEEIAQFRGPVKFPPFINISLQGKDIVRALVNPDPEKRLGSGHGASDIRKHAWWKAGGWNNMDLIRNEKPPVVPHFARDPRDLDIYKAELEENRMVFPDANRLRARPGSSDPFRDFGVFHGAQ